MDDPNDMFLGRLTAHDVVDGATFCRHRSVGRTDLLVVLEVEDRLDCGMWVRVLWLLSNDAAPRSENMYVPYLVGLIDKGILFRL